MPLRIPVFLSFLPLIIISLAMGVTTVTIFAAMHDHAIHSAMETSIKDSLRYVEEKVAAPMAKLRADALQLRENAFAKNAFAYQPAQRGSGGNWYTTSDTTFARGLMEDMIIAVLQNGYPYAYQSFRLPHVYNALTNVSNSSTNPDHYPWGLVLATDLGYSEVHFTELEAYGVAYDWNNETRRVNWTQASAVPFWDSRPYAYGQGVISLTPNDANGKWHSVEIWIEREVVDVFR